MCWVHLSCQGSSQHWNCKELSQASMCQHPEEGTLVTPQHAGTVHGTLERVHKVLLHPNPLQKLQRHRQMYCHTDRVALSPYRPHTKDCADLR